MKLSRTSMYAIYALGYLAGSNATGYTPVSMISSEFKLPTTHLAKIFQRLVRAGILSSSRGVTGGFALRKPPHELTIIDVIQAVDGPIESEGCLLTSPSDNEDEPCPLHDIWRRGQEAMIHELEKKSIADLGEELVMHTRRKKRRAKRRTKRA